MFEGSEEEESQRHTSLASNGLLLLFLPNSCSWAWALFQMRKKSISSWLGDCEDTEAGSSAGAVVQHSAVRNSLTNSVLHSSLNHLSLNWGQLAAARRNIFLCGLLAVDLNQTSSNVGSVSQIYFLSCLLTSSVAVMMNIITATVIFAVIFVFNCFKNKYCSNICPLC